MHASARRRPAQFGLILSMVLGALMLWVGSPVIWLWIGSQMTSSQQGRMGPYFVVAIGILASTIAVAFGLARLQRLYEEVTGQEATVRVRLAWLRSLRDDRQPDTRDHRAGPDPGHDGDGGGPGLRGLVLPVRGLPAARIAQNFPLPGRK